MRHTTQEPVTTERDRDSVTEHPCFAQIQASRVSGNTRLYDSDFRHHNYITVRIFNSQLHRSLARDWHFGKEEYIEVAMSESQWATFISAPNVGSGVPCTLKRKEGKPIPQLPEIAEDNRGKFSDELGDMLEEHKAALKKISEELATSTPGKKRMAEIVRELNVSIGNFVPNVNFMANQFDKHMENTVERAKQEVHGYVNSTIHRAGLDAIQQSKTPIIAYAIDTQEHGLKLD